MGVQVLSYDLIMNLDSKKRISKILDIVKNKGDVAMIEGRLSPEDETELISSALSNVSGSFTGVEVAFLDHKKQAGMIGKLKDSILKMLAKNRIGITVVGPANIISEIKMNPDKLEILFKDN